VVDVDVEQTESEEEEDDLFRGDREESDLLNPIISCSLFPSSSSSSSSVMRCCWKEVEKSDLSSFILSLLFILPLLEEETDPTLFLLLIDRGEVDLRELFKNW